MYYDDTADGIGLDLTPLVNAGTSAADSYAKIRAADAAVAAAKRRPTPFINQAPSSARRGMSPMLLLILGLGAVGGFFLVRKAFGRRR